MSAMRNWAHRVLIGALITALPSGVVLAASEASTLTLTVGSAEGGVGSEVVVPVGVQGSQALGALQMELVYDPAVLEPKTVDEGAALPAATMDDNPAVAGRWKVGLAVSKAFTGDGEMLRFRFRIRGGSKSAVTLANAHAWDQSTPPLEMLVRVQGGSVVVGGGPGWIVYAGLGGAAVVLLLVARAVARRRRVSATKP